MSTMSLVVIVLVCFLVLMYGFSLGRQYGVQYERERGSDMKMMKQLVDDAITRLNPDGFYILKLVLCRCEDKPSDELIQSVDSVGVLKKPQKWRDQ